MTQRPRRLAGVLRGVSCGGGASFGHRWPPIQGPCPEEVKLNHLHGALMEEKGGGDRGGGGFDLCPWPVNRGHILGHKHPQTDATRRSQMQKAPLLFLGIAVRESQTQPDAKESGELENR